MPRWNVRERQKIIDAYLNATGRNVFQPREFLAWLEPREDHPLHEMFFSKSDAEWAAEAREDCLRRWVSGLRVTMTREVQVEQEIRSVSYTTPAYASPTAGRRSGGGYVPFDASDPVMLAEVGRQASTALDAWIGRYRGVAGLLGVDIAPIEEIAAHLAGGVVQSAA